MEPAALPSRSPPQKHPLKDIGYGSVAGICSKIFEHPFDLVKVRLQSQPLDQELRFRGPWDCFRQTTVQEGFRGLYRGVSMPVIGAMAENASLFLVYGQVQRLIRHLRGDFSHSISTPLPLPYVALSAACAGATASFILTPIELIKCRMQVQQLSHVSHQPNTNQSAIPPKLLPGPLSIVRSALAEGGGFRGLWLGQTGTLLRETGGSAVWFCIFEAMSSAFIRQRQAKQSPKSSQPITKADLSSLELMSSGAVAGISYNLVFFPADSIKSVIQTESELKLGGNSKTGTTQAQGFYGTGRAIVKARGWRGLYAGCGITCMRSGPSSALIFWIVSRLESQFD